MNKWLMAEKHTEVKKHIMRTVLKHAVEQGVLIQIKNSYKLSGDAKAALKKTKNSEEKPKKAASETKKGAAVKGTVAKPAVAKPASTKVAAEKAKSVPATKKSTAESKKAPAAKGGRKQGKATDEKAEVIVTEDESNSLEKAEPEPAKSRSARASARQAKSPDVNKEEVKASPKSTASTRANRKSDVAVKETATPKNARGKKVATPKAEKGANDADVQAEENKSEAMDADVPSTSEVINEKPVEASPQNIGDEEKAQDEKQSTMQVEDIAVSEGAVAAGEKSEDAKMEAQDPKVTETTKSGRPTRQKKEVAPVKEKAVPKKASAAKPKAKALQPSTAARRAPSGRGKKATAENVTEAMISGEDESKIEFREALVEDVPVGATTAEDEVMEESKGGSDQPSSEPVSNK